ncbi:Alpha/Beta hydrolase protein [Trichoderma barbatum]
MLTIEEIRALSDVNPEFEPILNSGSPLLASWDFNTNIHQFRAMIQAGRDAAPKIDPSTLPYLQEDIQIPVRDDRSLDARVYRPREESVEGRPGLVVFHGGGYAIGDLDMLTWLCALFVKLGGVAVDVNYRHAPEHVFPAAVEDAHDATKWAAQNLESLGIDPEKGFLIGGESSGAEMAMAVAHLCLNDKLAAPLTGIYAAITGGVNKETVPDKYKDRFFSLEQNAEAPVLSTTSLEFVWKNHQVDSRSPLAFPLAFPTHKGLPKTYFQVCGLDPLRDCALVMEQVFKDEGVATRTDIYPGMPHAFYVLFPELEISGKQRRDAEEGLKWLLSK